MSKVGPALLAIVIGAACVNAVGAAAQKVAHKKPANPAHVTPVAQPVVPPGPLTPLTLAQMPSLPAQVSYHNGQLTIISQNATLGDILRMVRTQTGATVEVPPNATERVVGQFGPGPSRNVLASLLDGVNFNYILLGSPTSPDTVERVIVTAKSGPPDASPGMTASNISQPGYPTPNRAQVPQDNDDMSADEISDEVGEAEQEPPPDTSGNPPQIEGAQQGGEQPQVKTPEQMLQELQRQQQQPQRQGMPPQGYPTPQQQQPRE